jgi:hypothetical protein
MCAKDEFNKNPIIVKMKEEELAIIEEITGSEPGSATREDLLTELKMAQEIRIKEEESEVNTVNDFIHRISEEKRLTIEDKKSKREFIAKMVATGTTVVLSIVVLSFEEKGFIRSKVFGWIKPKI